MRIGNAGNATKNQKLSQNEIKNEMIDLKNESEKVEIEEPNENTHKAQKCETAISVIREYKDVIRTKRKNIICNAYQQDRVFK